MVTRLPATDCSALLRAVLVAGLAAAPAAAAAPGMQGRIDLGWREVWVDGDRSKYRQHVDLDDGPRLFDLGLTWQAEPPGDSLAPDRAELRLEDLGGDPYERISVEAARTGRYRAGYERRESDYFYEDLLVLPQNADPEGSTGGDFRHFDFRRTRDAAFLHVDAAERVTLQLGFDRYRKRGDSTTVMDIEREEFELEAPVDETMESMTAGVSVAWDRVTATLTERYSTFDYASSMFLPGLSPGSDPDAPTELERFFLDQPYEQKSWEHRLDVRARPLPGMDVGFTVLAGDMDVDLRAAERSQGTDFAGNRFDRTIQGEGALDQDRRLYELSAAYDIGQRVSVFGRARLSSLEQSGASTFESTAVSDWDIDTHRLEAGVELALTPRMRLAAGWTDERRDVDYRERLDGVGDPAGADSDARGYFVRWSYRPSPRLDLYAALEDDSVDDPFSLASPTDSRRLRLRSRFTWAGGVSLSAGYLRAERDNDDSGWSADSDQVDVRATYRGERLTLSAGVSRVELDRAVDALVMGGSARTLFAVDYGADADFADASATWQITPVLSVGGSARRYDNSGSFAVERDDARVFLRGLVGSGYQWRVEYRRVDFEEQDGLESFDADVLELSAGVRW